MADPHSGVAPDRRTPPRMPRWVRISLIVAGILILLVAVLMLTGVGGPHGPGRHMSAGAGVTGERAAT